MNFENMGAATNTTPPIAADAAMTVAVEASAGGIFMRSSVAATGFRASARRNAKSVGTTISFIAKATAPIAIAVKIPRLVASPLSWRWTIERASPRGASGVASINDIRQARSKAVKVPRSRDHVRKGTNRRGPVCLQRHTHLAP